MIAWDKKYELGIPVVDSQHMILVTLLGRLEEMQSRPAASPRDIAEILKHLVDYIRVHFADEEKLLERFHYGDFEKHRDQHRKFIEFVESFQKRFEGGETEIARPIYDFLKDWLLHHIAGSDRAYADFFQQTGVLDRVAAARL